MGVSLNLQEWKGSLPRALFWARCGCESLRRWNTSCSGPERSHPYDPGPAAKSWLDAPPGRSFSPQRFSHQVMLWSCGGDYWEQTSGSHISQIFGTKQQIHINQWITSQVQTLCWFCSSLTTHSHVSTFCWGCFGHICALIVHKNGLQMFQHIIKKG